MHIYSAKICGKIISAKHLKQNLLQLHFHFNVGINYKLFRCFAYKRKYFQHIKMSDSNSPNNIKALGICLTSIERIHIDWQIDIYQVRKIIRGFNLFASETKNIWFGFAEFNRKSIKISIKILIKPKGIISVLMATRPEKKSKKKNIRIRNETLKKEIYTNPLQECFFIINIKSRECLPGPKTNKYVWTKWKIL